MIFYYYLISFNVNFMGVEEYDFFIFSINFIIFIVYLEFELVS